MRPWIVLGLFVSLGVVGYGERDRDRDKTFDDVVRKNAERMLEEGRRIFRFDTFGDEAFWSGALKLHQAIAGERNGGVGPGVSPATALAVGLKLDAEALPDDVLKAIRRGRVNLNDPAVTLALLDHFGSSRAIAVYVAASLGVIVLAVAMSGGQARRARFSG